MASFELDNTTQAQAITPAAGAQSFYGDSTLGGLWIKTPAANRVPLVARATVNVTAPVFGATGNGVTDDTAAINAAIAAANAYTGAGAFGARGAVVYLPAGVYLISSALTSLASGVILQGEGRGATTILVATAFATGDVLTLTASSEYCEIRDIQWYAQGTRTSGAYINTNGANDVIITDFLMSGYFTGINVTNSSIKVYITLGVISSAASTSSNGIIVQNGAAGDTYIMDVVMSNGATIPASGINIVQTGHCSILRCNITKCSIGLLINPGASQGVKYLFVEHSLFDSCVSCGCGINPSAATSTVQSCKFTMCWFSGTTGTSVGYGLYINGAGSSIVDDIEFHNSRVLNNQLHGIQINYGTNIRFIGGTVAGNSQFSAQAYDGINVSGGVTDFSIQGMRIGPVGTATNTQRFGINLLAGASNRYTVTNNDLRGNGNGAGTGGAFSNNGTGLIQQIGENLGGPLTGLPIVAATAAINTAETVICQAPAGSNGINPGTTYEFHFDGTCTASAANVSTFTIRLGTAGTTADAAIATFTVTSAATGTAIPFSIRIKLTFRTVGTAGTVAGSLLVMSQGLATGTSSGIQAFSVSTSQAATTAAPNTTLNDLILSATYKSAATTTTTTFQEAQAELKKAA